MAISGKVHCLLGIPDVFKTSILVPILKKASLDPTLPSNYRPITLSSVFSKLFEAIIMPDSVDLSDNQFGFRYSYCTSHGTEFLNDKPRNKYLRPSLKKRQGSRRFLP